MAKTVHPVSDEVQRLTSAEVSRQIHALDTKRRIVLDELVRIEQAQSDGAPVQRVAPEDVQAARQVAANLLNGHAPASLKEGALSRTRYDQLNIEIKGIDIAIDILQSDQLKAKAAESVQWIEDNQAKWRDLCREIIVTVHRLVALESRAVAMRQEIKTPVSLDMAAWIGGGMSIWDTKPLGGRDWLSRPRQALLDAGIINRAEFRELKDQFDGK
jgi:hypothetical protein